MKIGIIAGEAFFKSSSFYISRLAIGQIVKEAPDTFFYIFDKFSEVEKVDLPENTKRIAVPAVLKGVLKSGIFQKQKLAAQIKKNEVKRLWVFDPRHIIDTNLHQTLIINNEHDISEATLASIEKCQVIITFSSSHKQKLSHLSPALEKKITVLEPVIQQNFAALSYDERLGIKENLTEGREYFVCADFETKKERFIELLKAFSAFKKLQQSNWKLVICLRSQLPLREKEELLKPLKSFKFRDDVVILNHQSDGDIAECMAGAYAVISVSEKSIFPFPVIEGLLCQTPVVTLKSADLDKYEMALCIINPQGAAHETNPEFIAHKMMALYKDENLRDWLSRKAAEVTQGFDAEENVKKLAKLLM